MLLRVEREVSESDVCVNVLSVRNTVCVCVCVCVSMLYQQSPGPAASLCEGPLVMRWTGWRLGGHGLGRLTALFH